MDVDVVVIGLGPGGEYAAQKLAEAGLRVVGVEKALEMVTSGQHVPAKQALEMGLVDEIVPEGQLKEGAVAFAKKAVAENKPLVKVRENNAKLEAAKGKPEAVQQQAVVNANKEAAAVLGFTSAVAAYGAFFIPKSYGTSIASGTTVVPQCSTSSAFFPSTTGK